MNGGPNDLLRLTGHGPCPACGDRFAYKRGAVALLFHPVDVPTLRRVCPSCAQLAIRVVLASARAQRQATLAPFATHFRHLARLYEQSTKADGRHIGLAQAADVLESGRLDALADPEKPAAASDLAQMARVRDGVLTSRPIVQRRPSAFAEPRPPKTRVAGALSAYERKVLSVLVSRRPDRTSKTQLAVLAAVSRTSGSFGAALTKLRAAGFVVGTGDALEATDEGAEELGPVDPFPRGPAVVTAWVERVGPYTGAILEIVTAAYPEELSKAELAARAGCSVTSGSYGAALTELRALGLVVGRRASEELMAAAREASS